MDFFAHGLASYAMAKAFFPRASATTVAGVVLVGVAPDLDMLTAQVSPHAFLFMNHTWGHSLISAAGISVFAAALCLFLNKRRQVLDMSRLAVLSAMFCAAGLHLLLDICQSASIRLLWPFSLRSFAVDWVPYIDIWIIFILIAGLLIPQMFALVTEEIGVKRKGFRGRNEAVVTLAVIALYVCLRMVTHAQVVAALVARSYGTDVARNVAALPNSQSPFHWLGMVETESAWHLFTVAALGGRTQITGDRTSYKPEESSALNVARNTAAAREFLERARFPTATVQLYGDRSRVTLREANAERLPDGRQVAAVIDLDAGGRVLEQGLEWDPATK